MDILAPAGNFEKLIAGLGAGADGFYLGLERFSARSSAGNFDDETLSFAFLAGKIHQKKVYIAINTLLNESEIPDVIEMLAFISGFEVAGVIIQDLGLISVIKKHFPKLPLVASTQMSVHNLEGVNLVEESGFDQVVLARELSLSEIHHIKSNSHIKLEVFIHGALCFSYSGQCLFSSMIGGRSANRGQCAQICRKQFSFDRKKSGYLISAKDLESSDYIENLRDMGVESLKIEGRMRSPGYVFSVVNYYNELLFNGEEVEKFKQSSSITFDRGNSVGYFNGKNDDLVDPENSSNHGLILGVVKSVNGNSLVITRQSAYNLKKGDGIAVKTGHKKFGFILQKEPQNFKNKIKIYEQTGQFRVNSTVYVTSENEVAERFRDKTPKIPLDIVLSSEDKILTVTIKQIHISFDLILEKARSKQDFKAFLQKKLSHFSHDIFEFADIFISVEEGIFIAYSTLRERLKDELNNYIERFIRVTGQKRVQLPIIGQLPCNSDSLKRPELVVIVHNEEQFELAKRNRVKICLDFGFFEEKKDKNLFSLEEYLLLLPVMIKDKNYDSIKNLKKNIIPVCSNLGEVNYFEKSKRRYMTSHYLNITNSRSAEFLFEHKSENVQLSLEVDLKQFSFQEGKNYGLRVFGEFPVMTSEYCIIKNRASCSECKKTHYLGDERNAKYRVKPNSFCQNEIYYHKPLFLGDGYNKLLKYPLSSWWINLDGLDIKESNEVILHFIKGLKQGKFDKTIHKNPLPVFSGRYNL